MKSIAKILVLLLFPCLVIASPNDSPLNVISHHNVSDPTTRLTGIITNKGMKVFATIDHAKNAEKVGVKLPATSLILFGNPKLGTKLMSCQQSIAIDLPMKFLVADDGDSTIISYNSPIFLKERHQVEGCDAVFGKMTKVLAAIAAEAAE